MAGFPRPYPPAARRGLFMGGMDERYSLWEFLEFAGNVASCLAFVVRPAGRLIFLHGAVKGNVLAAMVSWFIWLLHFTNGAVGDCPDVWAAAGMILLDRLVRLVNRPAHLALTPFKFRALTL